MSAFSAHLDRLLKQFDSESVGTTKALTNKISAAVSHLSFGLLVFLFWSGIVAREKKWKRNEKKIEMEMEKSEVHTSTLRR